MPERIVVLNFGTQTVPVKLPENISEEELYNDVMSYALNVADWSPEDLVSDVLRCYDGASAVMDTSTIDILVQNE